MKNVVELIRVSTEQQAAGDRGGIPAQREANKRTARIYGLHIVKTIEIVDVSGASVLTSPKMKELLRLMESPDIQGVVAKEFSRLMRPEKFTDYALLQQFIDTNTLLYLPEGPIDLASKMGRLLGTIRAAVAGLERREITERMQDAKEALRRAGKHPGGAPSLPYGVGYSKERGWYFTPGAEKVKQAFALFRSGQTSYNEIGQRLNIARTSVRFILENPIYTGWRVYDEKRDPSALGYVPGPDGRQGYRRKIKRAPDEVIRVRVLDGLVSEKDFARVQQLIELKRQKHWRVRSVTPGRYSYNGFLVCGDCGNLLYTHSSKYDFYLCKSRHTRERRRHSLEPCSNCYMLRTKLELKIDSLLGDKLQHPDFLSRVVEQYNGRNADTTRRPAFDQCAMTNKLTALAEKKQRILETFYDGVIDREQRNQLVEEIHREISAYRKLLLHSAPQPEPSLNQDVASLLALVEPFAEWEFLEREDKRELLRHLCPEISIYRYTIKSLTLNLLAQSGNEDSRSRRAGSPS